MDYGLRQQFWIPRKIIEKNEWDLDNLRVPLGDRVYKLNSEIKNCPFCGGVAEINVLQELRIGGDEGVVIQCTKCLMNTASINGTYSSSSSGVIKLWNRRVLK